MPDLVPAKQVGLASGLMGLMILIGVGGGAMLVAVANSLGDARFVVFAIMAVELTTMLLTVYRVRDGRQGIPREGRSWLQVARGAWGTDILAERSYVWLLGSRLFFLMTSTTLTAIAFFYMADSFGLGTQPALDMAFMAAVLIVAFGALATVPSGRLSERVGRKRMIYASAVIGSVGMACLVILAVVDDRAGLRGPGRGRRGDLPGRGLGAHDRHHPEGRVRSVHGDQQRRDGVRGRDRLGRGADPRRLRQRGVRPGGRAEARLRGGLQYYLSGRSC